MRIISAAVGIGIALAAATGCSTAATSGSGATQPPSSTVAVPSSAAATVGLPAEQQLWALAVRAATADGSTVKDAQAVRSTHARAVQVTMQDIVEGDQPVWVIQLEGVGDFVCNSCTGPQGALPPRGRFQVLVVDATTLRSLDGGLSSTKADLSQLGVVVDLHG